MKKIIFYLTIVSFLNIQSQEVAFTVGTNYTDYSFDANDDFKASGMGSHFEMGYTKKIGKNKTEKSLGYSLSLNLNQYNASYGNMASSYSWETSYVGVRNGLVVPLLIMDNGLQLDVLFGVSLSTILKGQQKVNNMVYDISDHSEFNGLTGWGDAGLKLTYDFKDDVKLALGYSMSQNFKITGKSTQRDNPLYSEDAIDKIKLKNSRINLSLIYKLN